jgi:competence protein ComEA
VNWLDRFQLSTVQRKGYLALLFLLFLAIVIRVGILFWPENADDFQSTLTQEFDRWAEEKLRSMRVMESFDPNTVADSSIYTYQISPYVAENWIRYRQHGKRFEKPEDLLKIYGMDSMWFEVNRDSIVIELSENKPKDQKFYFDPNRASVQQFVSLGIPAYLAERIAKYRDAGGSFSRPDDLRKIYGFPEDLYQELESYISIAAKEDVSTDSVVAEKKRVLVVELNRADSVDLIKVKGIGPTFAQRIIRQRDKLGGYVSKNQLLEVYGIDEERFAGMQDQLEVDASRIVPMNMNTTSFKELLSHPYLNYEQVKSLVRYREKIGPFEDVRDIALLENFSVEDVERLTPYLTVE